MKNSLGLILIFFFSICTCVGQTNHSILIQNVTVIPMVGEITLENQDVWIAHGKILKIENSPTERTASNYRIVDGTNKYLIPGLSEMHYHWRSTENGIEHDLKLLLANGITTVRNMAEYGGQDHVAVGKKINSGALLGPDYYTTGPYLKQGQLQSKEQIDQIVESHVSKGYDFLKLADNLPKELYLHLLEKAQKSGIPVIGHAQRKLPLEFSLRMKSIEHVEDFIYVFNKEEEWNYLNNNTQDLYDTANSIQQSGLYVTPTLVVFETVNQYLDDDTFKKLQEDPLTKYLPADQRAKFLTEKNEYRSLKELEFEGTKAPILFSRYLEWMKMFTKILSDSHVMLMSGSDTFGVAYVGFSLHREFELMQEVGMKPYDILRTTTVNPARYLGKYAEDGTISEGKRANMVLLNKNPLEDISNTQTIESVILNGRLLDRGELDNLLKDAEIH
ncbi:amidohydrolase family protein [Muricauda sp. CAU 1633]|uniref:amidohydrolase family protein n=1 Tax=Allomuricauda sp. CAU 1633 TaxID=2816036 RepID=UPI001A8F6243|nr:amidohydrolase family protein [Muricauda sp. CAU 1633]MBO0322410.1 amidohydrolase family protein [Muricauda sp. CAU 1633]